jgi:putative SOS response-associated peptidase YedK
MCYNYSLTKKALQVINRYSGIHDSYNLAEEYDQLYHVAGFRFQKALVIASDQPDTLQAFNWGLIPSWTKSEKDAAKIRAMTLNARSDSLYEKPAYRNAAKAG